MIKMTNDIKITMMDKDVDIVVKLKDIDVPDKIRELIASTIKEGLKQVKRDALAFKEASKVEGEGKLATISLIGLTISTANIEAGKVRNNLVNDLRKKLKGGLI